MTDTLEEGSTRTFYPNTAYTYSVGWQMLNPSHGVTNDRGFPNSISAPNRAGVLIAGNSYVESLMLPYSNTMQGYLERKHPGMVAAAGISGNTLADSLINIDKFAGEYKPKTVVLFIDKVSIDWLATSPPPGHNALVEHDGKYQIKLNPYKESGFKPLAARSALFRYVYYNLKVGDWFGRVKSSFQPAHTSAGLSETDIDRILAAVLDRYVELAAKHHFQPVVLLDGNRDSLYQIPNPTLRAKNYPQSLARCEEMAIARSITVVNMQKPFEAHWQKTGERLDWWPQDRHWNSTAHKIAARELEQVISLP